MDIGEACALVIPSQFEPLLVFVTGGETMTFNGILSYHLIKTVKTNLC